MRNVICMRSVMMVVAVAAMALWTGPAHAQQNESAKLLAFDGEELDTFGWSVSVSGDTAIVGAPGHGSAYVFEKVGGVWTQQPKLLPSDGASLGESVSVSGDTAVVGGANGSAYVFIRSGGTWTQQDELLSKDGVPFGNAVSVNGDTAVVGAIFDGTGSAYVFERVGDVWMQQGKLLVSDGVSDFWFFGQSVSVSGDIAVVGASKNVDNRRRSGFVYVFERVGGVWMQRAKLLAFGGTEFDGFGQSVSVSGDTVVAGSFGYIDDNNGSFSSGSAYVFERVGGVWTQQARLLASDGGLGDRFGWSVSVSGDTAVVGKISDSDNGLDSGSAYVFKRVGGVWTEQTKLLASDGAALDWLGWSVSVSGDTAVVGAHLHDDNGTDSGSAYVFDLCPADFNGDGFVDTRDFFDFLNAWFAKDPLTDWDGNGIINILDLLAFFNAWTAGCP